MQIAPGLKPKAIDVFLPLINHFAPIYFVSTHVRLASYIAQVLHESGELRYVQEIWGPTAQQKKYERDFKYPWNNRLTPADRNYVSFMLGNSEPGDGKFYKGHGLLQITGRANHKLCSMGLFGDDRLLRHPELLTVPEYAVQSSFWFWKHKQLNTLADTPGIKDETKKINGGLTGLEKRQQYYDTAVKVLIANRV
jgi:putative chitinase